MVERNEIIKCHFSTFIDDITITCSREYGFDEHGWPEKECLDHPCSKIKRINEDLELRRKNGKEDIEAEGS